MASLLKTAELFIQEMQMNNIPTTVNYPKELQIEIHRIVFIDHIKSIKHSIVLQNGELNKHLGKKINTYA